MPLPHIKFADWRKSRKAMFNITAFGVCTVLGYLIWQLFLWRASPEFLLFNTFFWLFVLILLLPYERSLLFMASWSLMGEEIWKHSLHFFLYWATFWVAMSLSTSVIGLAIFALSIVFVPIVAHTDGKTRSLSESIPILVIGVILLLAVFAIKANVPFKELSVEKFTPKDLKEWAAIGFFLLAVFFDAYADKITLRLGAKLDTYDEINADSPNDSSALAAEKASARQKKEQLVTPAMRTWAHGKTTNEIIQDAHTQQSNALGLLAATITLMLARFIYPERFELTDAVSSNLIWYLVFLCLLGVIGTNAKKGLLYPLYRKKLKSFSLQPIFCGRQVFYIAFALLIVYCVENFAKCDAKGICTFGNGLLANVDGMLPTYGIEKSRWPQASYILGISCAVLVWIITWFYFCVVDFFDPET